MEIISVKEIDMSSYGKSTTCNVHCVHVKINDIDPIAHAMIKDISDTSWISKLDAVSQISFNATSQRTIVKLVNIIVDRIDDTGKLAKEFGEYLVSHSAQNALESNHKHIKLPLAELLKEKDSGNPGFDFHTESKGNNIIFGEAKYSAKGNPRAEALDQLHNFISLKKDAAELIMLEKIVTPTAITNFAINKKGYVAAFSLNSKNPDLIFKNALESDVIDDLINHEELYLIAIEV